MGYENYFAIIPKKVVKDIQNKTYQEIIDNYKDNSDIVEDDFIIFNELVEDVFGFGKLYFDDFDVRIMESGKPLFNNKDTQESFDDYCPYLVTKEAIKIAIEAYRKHIVDYYHSNIFNNAQSIYLENLDKETLIKCAKDCRYQLQEWSDEDLIDLSDDKYTITESWLYQYSIFNLAHLYKTIDFKKYDLIFYGR